MKSLSSRLAVYFSLVIIIILTMIGGITYNWTKKAVELRVSQATVETLKQIEKNMLFVFSDIQDISLFLVSHRDIRNYSKMSSAELNKAGDALQNLNEEFANITNSKTYISSINVYADNGLSFETAGPSREAEKSIVNEYAKRVPANGTYILTPTYKRLYQAMGMQYVISFYRQINDINDFSRRLGILRIDVNETEINRIYKDMKLGNTGYIFIVNKDGYIVSHSDKEQLSRYIGDEAYFTPVFSSSEGYYRKNIDGKDMLVTYYTSHDQNLIFIGMVPFRELLTEVEAAGSLTVLIMAVGAAIAILISYFISLKITTPVKKLIKLMRRVEDGNLDVVIDIRSADEIGALGRSFNSMTGKLKTLIEEVYKNQISRKEAELKALQAQINPHFLYNTLDVIYWTSRIENAPKTGKIVSALAKLFKLGLNKGSEITTIEKEVEHLQSYLFIQKMRYDEEPEIVVDVDPGIYHCTTIKLILQPIVENALIHGIAGIDGKGCVKIHGHEDEKGLLFDITDNGVGMDDHRIREVIEGTVTEKKGYGLKNVDDRIKLYFGEEFGLKIYSQKGMGTRVQIRIPKVLGNVEVEKGV